MEELADWIPSDLFLNRLGHVWALNSEQDLT